MKKLIPTLISILFLTTGFAQSGTVIYKNDPKPPEKLQKLKKTDPEKYRKYSTVINRVHAVEKQITYHLTFNVKAALFKPQPIMAKDKQFLTRAIQDKNTYYYDRNEKKRLYQTEESGKYFLVSEPALKWKILNETKEIEGYPCQKATSEQIFHSFDADGKARDKIQPITAWFTKQIPLPYGPENYAGLPGLILELSSQGKHYKATKIKLTDKDNAIAEPTKGKQISAKAFAKKMNLAYKSIGF